MAGREEGPVSRNGKDGHFRGWKFGRGTAWTVGPPLPPKARRRPDVLGRPALVLEFFALRVYDVFSSILVVTINDIPLVFSLSGLIYFPLFTRACAPGCILTPPWGCFWGTASHFSNRDWGCDTDSGTPLAASRNANPASVEPNGPKSGYALARQPVRTRTWFRFHQDTA